MAEQYIFSAETEEIFYDKLDRLHDEYVHLLLLNGVAPKGTDIESIKMTKNPDASLKYCQKVIGGLTNIKPQLVARLTEDRMTRLECIFTNISDNYMFMIQNVMDWPKIDNFSCQVWYMGETQLKQIKEIWEK